MALTLSPQKNPQSTTAINRNRMKKLDTLIRPNIKALKPYSSARDEYTGSASIFLDANENPYNAPFNRYPDPLQQELKAQISNIKDVDTKHIFLGNGSDEPIDLLFRAFCEPTHDNIVSISPSYGMYQVCADINNTPVKKVSLNEDFSLDTERVLDACDENTKIIFLCSPNNPSGNLLESKAIAEILNTFQGIVVVDEAYIDFAPAASWLPNLKDYPNLVILQTFSKAWGMAGIRLGMAFASEEIISVLNKIKYPYNLNILTQQLALELIADVENMEGWVDILLSERWKMEEELKAIEGVQHIYPSDANFLLVKIDAANDIYNKLVEQGTIVRNRSKVELCNDCLRITIGSPEENAALISQLKNL